MVSGTISLSATSQMQEQYRHLLHLFAGSADPAALPHSRQICGVYGCEKLSANEPGLREMLSPDGATKERKTVLKHLRQRYHGSDLHHWRNVFSLVNRARYKR